MNLTSKSWSFLYSGIPLFHTFTLKNLEANHMPQRAFFRLLARHNHDRFALNQRKKKPRRIASQVRKALWKQSQVFQLDPVKGDAAPVIPDTKQQKTLSQAILHGITDMLMGSDLNCNLRSYQLEITEVKITQSLGRATVYWSVRDKLDESKEDIQTMLDENADHIRMLLPVYTTLNHFPSLIFTKDMKADFTREVENLLQEARNRDNCEETSEITFEDRGPV